MPSTRRRLDRLATHLHAVGCATCRHWDTTRVQIVPPGVAPLLFYRPDRCPSCGRRAPDRTATVLIIAPCGDADGGIAS